MGEVTIIYWRDIPAQVLHGSGRRATKRELPERFQVAIDMAAMRGGARETDAYLADWRRAPMPADGADPEAMVANVTARIEAEYDAERLRRLVEAGGKEA
ncbi:virulence factor [Prosthecodimorpha staleyi]|uniref:Virulence factor n=1 Tax=Prosthecodimorpha staleyi TaxID=2840188 RepID=A0A947DA98_9HYPH|nr:virulence factor [Prosthecodimorpha staleyi]MBT9291367.1 virulence factor [Prosthecodimorpha staleyi]